MKNLFKKKQHTKEIIYKDATYFQQQDKQKVRAVDQRKIGQLLDDWKVEHLYHVVDESIYINDVGYIEAHLVLHDGRELWLMFRESEDTWVLLKSQEVSGVSYLHYGNIKRELGKFHE